MSKNHTNNSIKLMRRLVSLSESQLNGDNLTESGTPTTALTPATNATRQMAQDQASTGKEGIPAPSGGNPSEKNAAQTPAVLDPNGEDKPAQIDPMYGKSGSTMGMQIPADIKPAVAGPGTDTVAPGSDTSAGVGSEIAKAKAKSGVGLRLESMTPAEILSFLIEHFGGAEAFALELVAENCPFELAEALSTNDVDFEDIDERIVNKLAEMAAAVMEDTVEEGEDDLFASIIEADPLEVLAALLDEGLGDTIKSAVQKIFSRKKETSGSNIDRLKAAKSAKSGHPARAAQRKPSGDRVISTEKRDWGSHSDTYKSFRREGPSARSNR